MKPFWEPAYDDLPTDADRSEIRPSDRPGRGFADVGRFAATSETVHVVRLDAVLKAIAALRVSNLTGLSSLCPPLSRVLNRR